MMKYTKYLGIALLTTAVLCVVTSCGEPSGNKPRKPANFFTFMGELLSGRSGEKRTLIKKDIQAKVDSLYPQLGLEVTAIASMANSGNMNFDLYQFAAYDSAGICVESAWNDYSQTILNDLVENHQKAVLHKRYGDALRANIPPEIPADTYYYTDYYTKDYEEPIRFCIFCTATPTAENKDKIIRDIRQALRLTTRQLGWQRYHASLGFTWKNEPRAENYRSTMGEITYYYNTYLVAVLTSENEETMPNFIAGGKAIRNIEKEVEKQLFSTQKRRQPEFLLVRQDDFSELFFIFEEEFAGGDSARYTTAVVETHNLRLKEKNEILRPDSVTYTRYCNIELLVPPRFRYQHIPNFRERTISNIKPYYEPH